MVASSSRPRQYVIIPSCRGGEVMNESSEIRQDDPLDSSVEKPSSMPEEHQPIKADAPALSVQAGVSNAEGTAKTSPLGCTEPIPRTQSPMTTMPACLRRSLSCTRTMPKALL